VNFLDAWSSGIEHGAVQIRGELSRQPDGGVAARKSTRVPVALGAGLRQRGSGSVSVEVVDLSVDGFRAQCYLEVQKGDDVWLRLPGLEAYCAKIVWTEGTLIGCAFDRPLHPAVLEMIVKRARR
jgi:hypothetical protein